MKKYSILMILSTSLFVFSCGDDDSEESVVKCLKCAGKAPICVGDMETDPGQPVTITLELLELTLALTNTIDPGACVINKSILNALERLSLLLRQPFFMPVIYYNHYFKCLISHKYSSIDRLEQLAFTLSLKTQNH